MSSRGKLGTGGGGRSRGPEQEIVVSWARETGIESLATGPEGPLKDEIYKLRRVRVCMRLGAKR